MLLEHARHDPDSIERAKALEPDRAAINAAAELIIKSLLIGIDNAVSGNRFADEAEDIAELPFYEAVEYLRKKDVLPAKKYYELSDKARFRAFTLSRIADGDVMQRVKDMLAQNVSEGGGLGEFLKKTDEEIMQGCGLGGSGGGWYWENVYRTNVQTAYNAGRAIGYEAVPPIALELVGINDARQTAVCRRLTQPPVRRLYTDEFWRTHWPPFHFGCRTTVRAIYDTQELEEHPVTGVPEGEEPAKGFGRYPVTGGSWWKELKSMAARARKYGVQQEIERAIHRTTNISEKKLQELLDDVVERNQKYYAEVIDLAKVTAPETLLDATTVDAIKRQTLDTFKNITTSMAFMVPLNEASWTSPLSEYDPPMLPVKVNISSSRTSFSSISATTEISESSIVILSSLSRNPFMDMFIDAFTSSSPLFVKL